MTYLEEFLHELAEIGKKVNRILDLYIKEMEEEDQADNEQIGPMYSPRRRRPMR